jgi:two-component system chemotaxis response regulator CheB
MLTRRLKVLVVDDSTVDRMLLVHIINSDARLEVVGIADNGGRALALNVRLRPDVIIMDVTMPERDGISTATEIMQTHPVPIVICTALKGSDATLSFRAMEAGAVALIGKPEGIGHPDYPATSAEVVNTLLLMAEVKVVRRIVPRASVTAARPPEPAWIPPAPPGSERGVVVIGASTGGPPALQTILSRLPEDFPLPIVVVQHIAPGFLAGMATWLQLTCALPVRIAAQGEEARPGIVYLAPDNHHLELGSTGRLLLTAEALHHGHRPAVGRLFASLAASPLARRSYAVLLTGMGADGAEELRRLREVGTTTLAQDAASCVVNGMPGAAVRLGAATHVLPPESIAQFLIDQTRTSFSP